MTTVGWEWMWNRTKRLADLLYEPRVLDGATQMANTLDRYCDMNGIDRGSIRLGDAIFVKGLQYIEFPLERS